MVSLLPEGDDSGASSRDVLFTPGAVIPIEAVETTVARAEPSLPAPPPPSTSDPATAPSDQSPSQQPSPRGAKPDDPDTADTEPTEQPGMLLHGARDGARPSTAGSGKVVVDPSMLQGSAQAYQDSLPPPGSEGPAEGPAAPAKVDYSFKREKGKLVYRDPHGRFVATLRADGRVDFKNKGGKASMTQIGMAGPGDLLMAASGQDPYARLKSKLLKATFEMRLNMAVGFQKKQIDKRLNRLQGELDKIWADPRRNLAARKELVFQRWDECDEPENVASAPLEVPGFGTLESSELDEARHDARALGSTDDRALRSRACPARRSRCVHGCRARRHESPARQQAVVQALRLGVEHREDPGDLEQVIVAGSAS